MYGLECNEGNAKQFANNRANFKHVKSNFRA